MTKRKTKKQILMEACAEIFWEQLNRVSPTFNYVFGEEDGQSALILVESGRAEWENLENGQDYCGPNKKIRSLPVRLDLKRQYPDGSFRPGWILEDGYRILHPRFSDADQTVLRECPFCGKYPTRKHSAGTWCTHPDGTGCPVGTGVTTKILCQDCFGYGSFSGGLSVEKWNNRARA